MRARLMLIVLGALSVASGLHAQDAGFTTTVEEDWKNTRVILSVSRVLDPTIPSLQRAQADAEAAIDAAFTGLLLQSLSPLVVDSSRTVGSLAGADPAFFSWIQGLARAARKETFHLSSDFKKATAGYSLPLFTDKGIASPLFPGQVSAIGRRLGFVPTREFSGLLIYAMDPLPAMGGAETALAAPALFPRLFDEEMNVFFEKGMCAPATLVSWGMVGYADSADQTAILTRCGANPLTVVARAVFGRNRTDLVIPTLAVRQILALEENRKLLRDGKVLIIYPSLK